jgi:hypothetical protein
MSQAELNALIVTNIADLDAAARQLGRLEAEVGDALDELVTRLSRERGWDSYAEWNDDEIWVAPRDWRNPGSSTDEDHKCEFSFDVSDPIQAEADSFWLTQFVGKGYAQLGFRWSRNDITKARWRKAVSQHTDLIADIRGLGFGYGEKDGSFFLPLVIDPTQLSAALAEESPEQALQQPLADAFAVLDRAKSLFDSLLERVSVE